MGLKVLSLFDGISCGMVALERAGFKVERYVSYEIEKSAIDISRYNYPMIEQCGDVFKADFTRYKGFDLLIGGSPCTFWSVARKGRETTSDGLGFKLFKQYVRALRESGCRYFLYENNYGMADEIKHAISEELGVQPIMIDSQLLSAQRRKRLYWTNIPNITLPDDKGLLVKDVICDDPKLIKYFDDRIRNTMIKCENYIKYDLGGKGHYSQQDRLYFLDKKAPTVPRCRTETKFNVWLGGEKYKKTCPLEIERLQTLPDNYTEFGMDKNGNVKVMPKTRRFEAIGNGWTVDVIAHIFSFMKDYRNREKHGKIIIGTLFKLKSETSIYTVLYCGKVGNKYLLYNQNLKTFKLVKSTWITEHIKRIQFCKCNETKMKFRKKLAKAKKERYIMEHDCYWN